MNSKEKLKKLAELAYGYYDMEEYEHYIDKKEKSEGYDKVFELKEDIEKDLLTKDVLLKCIIPFLSTFTDLDGKIHICSYYVYVEDLKRMTTMKPISEEEFNLIKEAFENEL
jgi:hypothetical protein